jgi:hypothetical protein
MFYNCDADSENQELWLKSEMHDGKSQADLEYCGSCGLWPFHGSPSPDTEQSTIEAICGNLKIAVVAGKMFVSQSMW